MNKDFGSFSPCLSLFLLHKNISKITNLKNPSQHNYRHTYRKHCQRTQCTDFFSIFKRKSLWGLANTIQVIGAELNLYSSSANATCLLASFMYLIFISVYQQCILYYMQVSALGSFYNIMFVWPFLMAFGNTREEVGKDLSLRCPIPI